jgi:AcrR family transcriptional regulator
MSSDGRHRGRRTGQPDTRAEILEVARRHFLAGGYRKVTLRAVAAEARVDAALVTYYFGSKRGLLGAALALTVNPPEMIRAVIAGDPVSLPERVVRTLVSVWDDPIQGEPLRLTAAAAAHEPDMTRLLRDVVQTEMVPQLAEHFGGVDATARAAAFGAQLVGLILFRYWLTVEPVASMPIEDLVRFMSPGLHAAIRGPGGYPRPPAAGGGRRGG